MEGKVYLVGAGPGDPGLITLKGLYCLGEADVIIYDHLVDKSLLNKVRQGVELIYVGKQPKAHLMSQEQINALLVAKAREGEIVVRLKGGDPFVLGRGGEEAEVLALEGIPFEIVPGVTAAIAAPAYAGIPVTHRGLSSSFAMVTGHESSPESKARIAWDRIATGIDTLIFLMGMENLASITIQLIENSRPPATPAALIQWGTTPKQQVVEGTLADIVHRAREANIGSPAVLIVGEVVELRHKLRWFENKPLFGKRILVTRRKEQAGALSETLSREGAEPIEIPAIEIKAAPSQAHLDNVLPRLSEFHWLIFTSVNGVDAFFNHLHQHGLDSRKLYDLKVCAIGEVTATALRKYGIQADLVPQQYSSHGILACLKQEGIKGKRLLLPCSQMVNKELVHGLSELGAEAEPVVVYHTLPAGSGDSKAKELLVKGAVDAITVTSPSTVRGLITLMGGNVEALNKAVIACIGPVTAAAATEFRLRVDVIAKKYTINGLVEALIERYKKEAQQ
ncbi:MAG: Uroporphyrinogen-III C-methyltransferase [Dehalococcoidia bacterium]|nr:Uroporphyrinogen-III C-methyltransferase [Chloroflexota bacterium]